MEQLQLANVIKNAIFEGYLLVRTAEQRTSSNGSKYLDMNLCDISAEINAKMWDGTVQPPKPGTVVKVRALMQEFNNHPQLRIDKLRLTSDKDNVDMAALVPSAPTPGQEMLAQVTAAVDGLTDPELQALLRLRLEQCGDRLLYFPAATRLHHAERGGLLHHTTTMLKMARLVCQVYTRLDEELLIAGVILHDLCKIGEINADDIGLASDYTREGNLLGHIVMGVSQLDAAAREINMSDEKRIMLEHMLLAHHDLPEYGSPKPPMFPEAEVLHVLDLLDARMFEMNRALDGVNPGCFTDRIWSLDRKLYRRQSEPVRPGQPESDDA